MNNLSIIGRLVRDPELTYSKEGNPIANMAIAIDTGKEKTSFFDCVAFKNTADVISKRLKKGQQIAISGSIDQQKWVSKEGENRSKVVIIVNRITFIGAKSENQQATTEIADPWKEVPF